MMKKAIILAILFLTLGAAGAPAQVSEKRDPDKEFKCRLDGFVIDKDPKGTNVRDAPGLNGKIIETLEATDIGDELPLEPSVSMVGYSNGWLKILLWKENKATGDVSFNGTGWISAKKVTTNVQTKTNRPATLYAGPTRKSKKVGSIPTENYIAIVGVDCFGYKVTYKGVTGWLSKDDTCANTLTTCA